MATAALTQRGCPDFYCLLLMRESCKIFQSALGVCTVLYACTAAVSREHSQRKQGFKIWGKTVGLGPILQFIDPH